MEMEPRAESIILDPSRKLVPFGSQIWSVHQFGKSVVFQQNRDHRATAHRAGYGRRLHAESSSPPARAISSSVLEASLHVDAVCPDRTLPRSSCLARLRRAALGPLFVPGAMGLLYSPVRYLSWFMTSYSASFSERVAGLEKNYHERFHGN
jgi:hypothetical protein